ncbi:hypothetical protein F7725_024354 [Dissostichus mawsoni]|uniref:Protein kinase domain-containing protein n=1 Tax=Dissostichus mawsoni TaxID=36200 RepID=A0A7J5Y035_DISMA|nr:hypothetical protein F7725_024354 [Dissostichus mawsoni]
MSLSTLRKKKLQLPGSSTGPEAEIQILDVLHSVYQLLEFTSTGTFSSVAECNNTQTKESVAIKIYKEESQKHHTELAMLKRIHGLDPNNLVRFVESFVHKGYSCLAFERLDMNLHELLNDRPGDPLSLEEIKPIAQQLLSALKSLKTVGVTHTDINPQNIMLTIENDQLRVKIIDFGSAVVSAKVKRGVVMQAAAFRSPEVILGLPITEAVDMWSLGGVLATMYLGSPLFPQRCMIYQMKTEVKMMGNNSENEQRFANLLRKMLHLNPENRITPSDALLHPFITGLDADDSIVEESSEEDNSYADDGYCSATDTSEGASSNMSSTDVACADNESTDSFVSSLGVEKGGGDSHRATTVLNDAVSADQGTVTADNPAPPLTFDSTDAHIGSDGVSTRNSPGKRIRKFFGRMFRALCSCCSTNVEQ